MDLNRLKKLASAGAISRRNFIQLAIAAGLTVSSADLMFTTATGAEPKKGGRFRMGLGSGSTTDTLDPATIPDTFNQVVSWGSLRNSLTEVTADGSIIPDLAESFEASPNAKSWIFKLRKGVEFHNGKSLGAADVVASFNHHRGADTKSAAKPLLASVVDIKADGKDVVILC